MIPPLAWVAAAAVWLGLMGFMLDAWEPGRERQHQWHSAQGWR